MYTKLNKHYILCFTTMFFLLPIIYIIYKNKSYLPPYLMILLLLSVFSSILFWSNVINNKNNIYHTLDAFFARITIISFIIYNIYLKNFNYPFFISTFIMLFFYYISHINSKQLWCCNNHIFYHIFAHVFGLLSIYFTMFPI